MSSKKKRLGSRRRAPNQNETFNTDVTDSTSVAQCHIPEETESLNETANSHKAQRETQRSPSPDPLGNTRKLGSSQRHRVKNVQESVTDSHQNSESTEEVEHSSRGAALQPERQADVLLDSASGAQHAIVTNRPEVDLESFISIGENETQKSDISHSEEVKENVGVGVSELASDVTCQTDQQLIDSSSGKKIPEEKLPNVCSVTEEQRDDNTEMFISSTTEITTESIHTAENTANECSLQGTISSPKVEMPAEVEQNEYLHLSEVAQAHLEDAVNKGHENEIKLMGMHEIAYSSESVVHDGKSDNDHVYDTRKPQSSDIERDDPALRQVLEVEGTVEEQDVEPNEGQDNLPKVTAGDHSEAAVNKLQPTENQEKPQIDFSPENVTHDATDKSEIISGKTMDQTEVSDTYQYEMKVTNALDSPINRDNSNSDNTQEEHPKKENIFETSDQRNEDYDVCDIKKTQISDTDRVDTFHVFEGDTNPSDEQTGYQENEELLEERISSLQTLQSEINVPFYPQLQQNANSFQSTGHRRKMGSSRKSKGRPHVKDSGAESDQEPTVDVVGNTRDNETQEGTEMALEIKTEVQEKSMETLLKETDTFDLTQTEGVSEEVKGNAQDDTLVGIADLNSLGLQSSLTTAHLEIDQSNVRDDPDEEPPNLCSVTEKENEEGAEDTERFRPDGSLPDKYLLREDMESSFPPEKTTEELSSREPTEPECSVQQDSLSPQKEEVHTNEGQDDNSNLPKVTGDVNSKLMDQTEVSDTYLYKLAVTNTDGSPISLEESGSSLQTLQSEINVPSDPQLLQKDSSFHSIGHRRKMGSSRKSKGRPYVKDSGAESDQEPTVDVVGNTRDNETQEGTEMAIEIKTEVQEKSMETLLKETDTFDLTQTEGVSEEVKGNAQDDALVGIPDLNSLGLQSSLTTAHLEIDQSNVRDDPVYLYKLAVTNTDGSPISVEESGLSLQTLQSEINVPSDPQHLQKASSFHSIGHRRKMGSSRRNKVRPHVKDSGAESDQEPTVDVVGNTRDYETHEETEMALKKDLEVQERSMETFLKETDTFDMTQTEGVSDQVKGNAQDDNRVSIDLTSSSSAVDRQIVEHSNFRQTSDKELPKVCCVTEKDNRESSVALEISTERRPEEHNETECTVEQAEFSPLEDKLSINEGQKQPVTGTWHSHKSINQTKKEHESQETNVSKEIPKVELFSAPPTLDPCDFGLKQAETTVDVSEQSGTSSLQGMQEPNNSDDIVILHGRSTQKRRKMGSTRQTQFSGKRREKRAQTQESDPEADTGNLDRMEKVEELTTISTAEVSQSENAKLPPSVVYKEQQETNEARAEEKKLIGLFKDTSKALPPEQSASLSEEVVDPVEFVAADAKHHKGNAAVSGEPSHYTSPTEVLNTTNPRLSSSKDTPNYSMTGAASVTACEPTKSTRNDEERVENVDITKDIALISTEACVVADLETVKSGTERGAAEEHITTQAMELEPDNAEEAAPSRDPDMENAGPCLDPKNRRRKMGSTRRNLRTGSKQEDSHQTQDVSDRVTETVTNVADVRIESSSSKKDELQVDGADKDGGTETTESSHTSESHKPPPHRTFEENPVSQGRMLETEHQAAPSYLSAEPSTPPKDGLIAESAFGGRRRKMGSNRKSHQSHETQTARVDKMKDTQNERDVRSIREENPIETEELREESSKVDQSHKKQLANLSSSKEGDDATPVSEKTPEPVTAAQQYAGFQSQMFSLEERSDLRSKAYNVMMVGDSSVGKSSFMKRAQSGKFSLDLPASVGLDYCMWTVLVEGKPVVLQLWDTAGQERFHSITKQTFHKAHAFLLMYDITCSQSFFAVSYWERCIREAAAEGVTIILVGNKSDGAERQVKSQEADILAAEYKFEFMECSAATGENVVQCLETVARMLSQKDETREDNMVLRKEPQQKTKSRCC